MAAKRGRTITSFGQAFPSLSGGLAAVLITPYKFLNGQERKTLLNAQKRTWLLNAQER